MSGKADTTLIPGILSVSGSCFHNPFHIGRALGRGGTLNDFAGSLISLKYSSNPRGQMDQYLSLFGLYLKRVKNIPWEEYPIASFSFKNILPTL